MSANRKRSTKLVLASEATLVPETVYTELKFWDRLTDEEQSVVKVEGQQLAEALLVNGRSRLAIGEHLLKIKEVLEPKKYFVNFLKTYHFSVKSAYRYMNGYKNAQARLPEPILQAAMARGYDMIGTAEDKPLGIYTEAVRQLPPPTTDLNKATVNTWLDSVEQVRKKVRSTPVNIAEVQVPQDVDTLLKETFRFIDSRVSKLSGRDKAKYAKETIGYVMTLAGLRSQSFSPVEVPAGFKAERGRPRLVTQTAATA